MNVGDRIRSYRKQKKMSQEELAWMSNITPAYLGQVERGLKSPTITVLTRITSALHITLSELFSSPLTPSGNKLAAMQHIESQLSELTEDDLKRISAIIDNIIAIKGRRPS